MWLAASPRTSLWTKRRTGLGAGSAIDNPVAELLKILWLVRPYAFNTFCQDFLELFDRRDAGAGDGDTIDPSVLSPIPGECLFTDDRRCRRNISS
jgi:hypothetical protein